MVSDFIKMVFQLVAEIIIRVADLISFLIFIWCILSWFPSIKWSDQPFKSLDVMVRSLVAPFKHVVPLIGNIDISPLVIVIALEFMSRAIAYLLMRPLPQFQSPAKVESAPKKKRVSRKPKPKPKPKPKLKKEISSE